MNTTIVISEVLSTSWKNVKSQIWILVQWEADCLQR